MEDRIGRRSVELSSLGATSSSGRLRRASASRCCPGVQAAGIARREHRDPDGPVDLAPRHARRHGRLRPLGADQDGLLQEARHRREADRRADRRRARVHEVRRAEPGRHGLPVAGRPDGVDRQRHPRQVDLGHDLRARSSTSRCRRAARSRASKQLAGKKIALGSAGWSTIVDPILVGGGRRPEVGHLRERGQPVGAVGRERPGRRGARLGRAARTVGRPGPEAQVPDRHRLLEAAVERLLGAGGRPRATRRRSTSTRASCRA